MGTNLKWRLPLRPQILGALLYDSICDSGRRLTMRQQQKRVRLSDHIREDDEEPASLASQYEATEPGRGRMDDVSSDESSEDEATFERATQRLQRKSEKRMDNQAAESGIIESVTCTNFMCHTKLHIALGPLINFIIGHNGSGKSAVLTALTLCLGGKATATNRGQNLKSFVKEGTEYVHRG